VTSSSRTSINEEAIPESFPTIPHGKQAGEIFSVAGKSRRKSLFASKSKRKTLAPGVLPLNPEKIGAQKGGVSNPVVEKDEKLRRVGTFRKFIRLFVPS